MTGRQQAAAAATPRKNTGHYAGHPDGNRQRQPGQPWNKSAAPNQQKGGKYNNNKNNNSGQSRTSPTKQPVHIDERLRQVSQEEADYNKRNQQKKKSEFCMFSGSGHVRNPRETDERRSYAQTATGEIGLVSQQRRPQSSGHRRSEVAYGSRYRHLQHKSIDH